MLAAVTRRNHLALVQKPKPRLRPGWALVRVRLGGICNTDIEILRGYHNFEGTLGHEFVGDVVGVADVKDKDWIGRCVVGEINLACAGLGFRPLGQQKMCSYCRRGIQTHCARRRVLGILKQGHLVSTSDATQLRKWAVRPEDTTLTLKEIAHGILDQSERSVDDVPAADWRRVGAEFILADLEVAFTFLDVARTS